MANHKLNNIPEGLKLLYKNFSLFRFQDQIADFLFQQFKLTSPSDYVSIQRVSRKANKLDNVLVIEAGSGIATRYQGYTIRLGEKTSITARVVLQRQAILIKDIEQESQYRLDYHVLGKPNRAVLAVPIRIKEKVTGTIVVESKKPGKFTEDDKNVLQKYADIWAPLIEEARIIQKIFSEKGILENLLHATSIKDIWDETLKQSFDWTGANSGSLRELKDDKLIPVSREGEKVAKSWIPIKVGEGLNGTAVAKRQTIRVDNVKDEKWGNVYLSFNPKTRSELAVPILYEDNCYGVINLEHMDKEYFNEYDQLFVEKITRIAAMTYQNFQLRKEGTKKISRKDFQSFSEGIMLSLAHPLKDYASCIIPNLEIIRRAIDRGNYELAINYLADTEKSAKRAQSQAKQMIDMVSVRQTSFHDINKIIQETYNSQKGLKPQNVEVKFQLADFLPPVQVNENQISSVLQNLIVNAFNALNDGYEYSIVITSSFDKEGWVKVSVSDNGPGIEPAKKPYIGKRPVASSKRLDTAVGMGLYLGNYVIEIVHKGRFSVFSEPGVGTTVEFCLLPANESNT